MTLPNLIIKVNKYIDELPANASTAAVARTMPSKQMVEELLEESFNDVFKVCAVRFLKGFVTTSFYGGVLSIPDDMLRALGVFNTSNNQSITLAPQGSQLHRYQAYPHIAATAVKPVVVEFENRTMRLYPPTGVSAHLLYVRKVSGINTLGWDSSSVCLDDLLPAIAWQCAGKCFAISGDARSQTAMEMAARMIQ